jgi:TM2 domain-containing membrane protein YozV
MDRAANTSDEHSLETDGNSGSAAGSSESTVEVGVVEDRPQGTAPEHTTDESVSKQPLGPDDVYCWSCGVPIKSAAEICPQCGVRQRPPPTTGEEKSPGIAALASAVWTGAGQIYNGEIGKGIGLMALMFVSVLSVFVAIGVVTTPLIWFYSIYDAYQTAERSNQRPAHSNHAF